MNKNFMIEICSDLDYEDIVADISYKDYSFAMITQENGIDKMEIEIFASSNEIQSWRLPLDDFIEVVIFAKKRLIEMKKL